MILTIGGIKGGVGKTTLALNLAIGLASDGRDVLLIDGDEQRTAMSFTELRTANKGESGYTAVALMGGSIRTQVRQLKSKYSDIVIDVGGRDTGSLRAALTVTERILIPLKPRSFDLWSVDQTAALVVEAREINEGLQAVAILNEADPQGKDNQATLEALAEIKGIEICPLSIGRRKAFPNAAAAGLSVLEWHDDAKAAAEMAQLVQFMMKSIVH
jgi:chromosome partitioning protein